MLAVDKLAISSEAKLNTYLHQYQSCRVKS